MFLRGAWHRDEVRTGVSVRSRRSCWVPHISLSVLGRQDSEGNPGLASPHFLLAGFSLFSPPFEFLKGDLPFQVVNELRAEPRHLCGVRICCPRNRDSEPKEQRLPHSSKRWGAESRALVSFGKTGPACTAAAALGFRGSAWPDVLPGDAGGTIPTEPPRAPPSPAAWLRPPACY